MPTFTTDRDIKNSYDMIFTSFRKDGAHSALETTSPITEC